MATRLMAKIVAILGVGFPTLVTAQYQPPLPTAPPPATDPFASGDPVQAIRQAPDPSSAVNAFAAAQSAGRGNLSVQDAYMRRMVEFSLPEMAEAQAQDLIKRDTTNGVAWAVCAFMSAKRGDLRGAASQVDFAAQRTPDDPFVVRTAAQVVAWFDLKSAESPQPEVVRMSVEAVRRQEAGQPGYDEAYRQATEILKAQPPMVPGAPEAPAAPAPAEPQNPLADVNPPPATEPGPAYPPTYYPTPAYYPAPYPYPAYYPYAYDDYYSPSYGGYCYGYPWGYPCYGYGGLLIFSNRHSGHDGRHDHHDGHHDGNHDGNRGAVAGTGRVNGIGTGSTATGSLGAESGVTRAGTVARGAVPFGPSSQLDDLNSARLAAAALPANRSSTSSARGTASIARSKTADSTNSRQVDSTTAGRSVTPDPSRTITIAGARSSDRGGTTLRVNPSSSSVTVIRGGSGSSSQGFASGASSSSPRMFAAPAGVSVGSPSSGMGSSAAVPLQFNMPSSGNYGGSRAGGSAGWRGSSPGPAASAGGSRAAAPSSAGRSGSSAAGHR